MIWAGLFAVLCSVGSFIAGYGLGYLCATPLPKEKP
jgi:hypothetical protein